MGNRTSEHKDSKQNKTVIDIETPFQGQLPTYGVAKRTALFRK